MDEKISKKSIESAQQVLNKISDPIHGFSHAQSVVDLCKQLAKHFNDVDLSLLEISAWWHDAGRLVGEKNHEIESAKLLKENLQKLGASSEAISKACEIILDHNHPERAIKLDEAKILIDADKLDLLSPYRWQIAIDKKQSASIETAIFTLIPNIRDRYLKLDESRVLYGEFVKKFLEFIEAVNDPYFSQYKGKIREIDLL